MYCSANRCWLPFPHCPTTAHKGKQSSTWILRTGRNLAAQILPGKTDLDRPIDITPVMGPGDLLHCTSRTSGWRRGSTATVLRGRILCPGFGKFGQTCWQILGGTAPDCGELPLRGREQGMDTKCERSPGTEPKRQPAAAQGQLQGQSWSPRQPSTHRVCANTVEFICFFFARSSLFFAKKTFLISLHASPP